MSSYFYVVLRASISLWDCIFILFHLHNDLSPTFPNSGDWDSEVSSVSSEDLGLLPAFSTLTAAMFLMLLYLPQRGSHVYSLAHECVTHFLHRGAFLSHLFLLGSLLAEAPLSPSRELSLTVPYPPDPSEVEITGFLRGIFALGSLWLCQLLSSSFPIMGKGNVGRLQKTKDFLWLVTAQSDLPHLELSCRASPSILMCHDVGYVSITQ